MDFLQAADGLLAIRFRQNVQGDFPPTADLAVRVSRCETEALEDLPTEVAGELVTANVWKDCIRRYVCWFRHVGVVRRPSKLQELQLAVNTLSDSVRF